MLREDFLPDYGLSISSLAAAIDVSRQTVNELLRERRAVSPEMALRLSRLFGNSPEFWLNAQRSFAGVRSQAQLGNEGGICLTSRTPSSEMQTCVHRLRTKEPRGVL
jgi:addiction module HigA family antidote